MKSPFIDGAVYTADRNRAWSGRESLAPEGDLGIGPAAGAGIGCELEAGE